MYTDGLSVYAGGVNNTVKLKRVDELYPSLFDPAVKRTGKIRQPGKSSPPASASPSGITKTPAPNPIVPEPISTISVVMGLLCASQAQAMYLASQPISAVGVYGQPSPRLSSPMDVSPAQPVGHTFELVI